MNIARGSFIALCIAFLTLFHAGSLAHASPLRVPAALAAEDCNVSTDWANFFQLDGVNYNYLPTPTRALQRVRLGPQYATTRFQVMGHVCDPKYEAKDGDAGWLPVGTPLYQVPGYKPTFLLAAYSSAGALLLYEASLNRNARIGGDLLDLQNKVRSISVSYLQDRQAREARIRSAKRVRVLVAMVLNAHVRTPIAFGATPPPGYLPAYVIAFRLRDGLTIGRLYWPRVHILSGDILLPEAFQTALQEAMHGRHPATPRAPRAAL